MMSVWVKSVAVIMVIVVTEDELCMHVAMYTALKKSTVKMTASGVISSMWAVQRSMMFFSANLISGRRRMTKSW